MAEPVIVPHPNTIRGPIESEHNGLRDAREKQYISDQAALEADYRGDLAQIQSDKEEALAAAGLNPDGGTPSDYPDSVPEPQTAPANIRPGRIDNQSHPDIAPVPGDTVVLANASWSGNPVPTYTYQWYRHTDEDGNVEILADGGPIDDPTYLVTADDVGTTLHCRTTANNTLGNTQVDSAPSDTVVTAE